MFATGATNLYTYALQDPVNFVDFDGGVYTFRGSNGGWKDAQGMNCTELKKAIDEIVDNEKRGRCGPKVYATTITGLRRR